MFDAVAAARARSRPRLLGARVPAGRGHLVLGAGARRQRRQGDRLRGAARPAGAVGRPAPEDAALDGGARAPRRARRAARGVGVDDLERYADENDLVIVAAGKGEVAAAVRAGRGAVDRTTRPMRALALTYVTGMTPRPEFSAVSFNLVPGVGEYFVFPALTTTGPCEIMVFEGVPGGPMDCWGDVETPERAPRELAGSSRRSCRGRPSAAGTSSSPTPTASSPGASRPPCASRSASCPRVRSCSGWPTSSCSTTRSPARARTTPPRCAAVYLDEILKRGDGAVRPAWMEADLRALLGLRAVRHRLDERAARRRRRSTCSSSSAPPARTRRSPSASSTASTIRATSSSGS